MAMRNPKGRVNYEPNSWRRGAAGIAGRAASDSFPEPSEGAKAALRSETFADHYSQARQFFISQTDDRAGATSPRALTSSSARWRRRRSASAWSRTCSTSTMSWRRRSPQGLGMKKLPEPADRPRADAARICKPSPALSIIKNGPKRFEGRKLGVLVTDGADAALLAALQTAVTKAGAVIEVIAPAVGGVKAERRQAGSRPSRRSMAARRCSIDAVAVLPSEDGGAELLRSMRRPATSSPTPSRTASSSATPRPPRCWRRPASSRTRGSSS